MPRILFCLFVLALFGSCQEGAQKVPESDLATVETAAPAPELPSIPLEILEKIWAEGTQVDYMFFYYPFTMSMTEKPAIQHSLRHISEQPAPLKPGCQATGRVSYQIDGDIVLEADFYFTTGCTYFVFYEGKQKKYANYMTDEGINYFNNQIAQAQNLQKQAQGQ